jgi:1-acylglycerone phosphate reductase
LLGTYAASKRSLEIVAETLRLEVQPFGCNVIEFVTGAVESQGLSKSEDWSLPDDSPYKPIEETIKSRAQGNDGIPRMRLKDYAVAVIDAVVNRTSGKFWYGQNADMVKMSTTSTTVPQSAMVSCPYAINNGC